MLAVVDGDVAQGLGDFRPPELLPLLDAGEKKVDRESERQQDQTQSNGDVEVALAGFKHRSRRQNASFAPDIAAHHHRRADFGNNAAETGHDRCQQRQSRLFAQEPQQLRFRRADTEQLQRELWIEGSGNLPSSSRPLWETR